MNKCKCITVLVLGFAALVLCTPARAQNSKLNAPVSRQPTVGLEIKRGDAAAFACFRSFLSNTRKFADCINAAIDANRQQSTLSEPYEFGLYVKALSFSSTQVKQLKIDNNTKGSNGFILAWRKLWHDNMTKIMETNNLSFNDYCEAIGLEKCESMSDASRK